jgi:hypothetical protein
MAIYYVILVGPLHSVVTHSILLARVTTRLILQFLEILALHIIILIFFFIINKGTSEIQHLKYLKIRQSLL